MPWSDDFNRANGPIGNGWVEGYGNIQIVTNAAGGTSFAYAVNPAAASTGNQRAHIILRNNGSGFQNGSPLVKVSANYYQWYSAALSFGAGTITITLNRHTYPNDLTIGTGTFSYTVGSTIKLEVAYTDGIVTATVDDVHTVTASDPTFAANAGAGIIINNAQVLIDSFNIDAGAAPYLTITPTHVWAATPISTLDVEIHGALWPPPDNLDTDVTADHGTVLTHSFQSTTHCTITYTAALYQGTITITESHFGAQGTFETTADPPPDSGESRPLTEEGARILNDTGEACLLGTILTTCDVVDAGAPVHITDALDAILEQLGGFPGQIGPDIAAVSLPAEIKALSLRAFDQTFWTVDQVVETLGGAPTIYSNADLLAAIGNIQTGSNQDVLDALAAYFGASPPTIEQIGTMLSELATIAGYTLGDVRTWIEAIPPAPSLSPVLTAISNLRGGATTVQAVRDLLAAVDDKIDALRTDMTAIRTASSLTLQSVLDAIAAIEIPPASGYDGPPVWPGQSQVTFGTGAALADQLVLNGPMDGVVVNVTTPPRGLGQYMVGGIRLDYGQMRIAFETDRGDLEGWQYFGFEKAIYTPHTMLRASKARLQLLGALGGTITPWTRS